MRASEARLRNGPRSVLSLSMLRIGEDAQQENMLEPHLARLGVACAANESFSFCAVRATRFPEARMIAFSRYARMKWFRSVSILPGDQPAVVLENQSISRSQPQSFASESDPSL